MTTTRTTIDQFMRKAKGKALEVTGRATGAGDRRTRARGWMVRIGGDARPAGRQFSRKLRNVAHR